MVEASLGQIQTSSRRLHSSLRNRAHRRFEDEGIEMENPTHMDIANDLMAILNPEVASRIALGRNEDAAGVQSADDGDAGNPRFGGTEESQSIPSNMQRTPPKSLCFLGRKIMKFVTSVPARVGAHVAGCFGRLREMGGDRSKARQARGAAAWSPDMDPAVVGFDDSPGEPHFDYARLADYSEEAWREFDEWWASFLAPLGVTNVDDSDYRALLVLEAWEAEEVDQDSSADSPRSVVDLHGEESRGGWDMAVGGDFWGTQPTMGRGRVAREVERLENAMKSMTDSVINFMHNVRFVVSKISAYSTNFVARNTVGYSRPRHTDGESAVGLSETDISTALWHHSSSLDCLKPLLFDNIASSSAHVVFMEKPPKKASKRRHTPQFKLLPGPEGELLLPHNRGKITYYKNFLTKQQADRLLQATANARSWARTPVTFFGKQVLQPRDTAFFGTKLYTYSDERREPTGWEEDPPASNALHEMGKRIETFLGLPQDWFNVILANRYHNGRDFMGWHSDNERSLGSEPIIASISLGAERRFLVRLRKAYQQQQPPERIEYVLEHGSLLVMSGKMQSYYQHSLPKVALSKCNELRLNFTYRRVVNDSDHTKDQPAVAR